LITNNIISDVRNGKFSFGNFYLRRARRLFPALFFTLIATFVAGMALLTPEHFENLAASTVYTLASVSNFFFWSEAGYFDAAAQSKPLLHTWSLAIEEQFYLLWPVALVMLMRRPFLVPAFLIAAAVLSLAYTESMLGRDPSAAFYLLPFRVVEFSIGALSVGLVAYLPRYRWVLEAVLLAGLAMIVYAVTAYSAQTVFPGLHALTPCIGAALVILGGNAPTLGRVLSNRVMVGVGLISYSLYLIHWPILTLYGYWRMVPLDAVERVGLFAAAVASATIMYVMVEKPFRFATMGKVRFRPSAFALSCVALAVALSGVAATA